MPELPVLKTSLSLKIGGLLAWTRSNNMWKVGCFYGTGDALIEKAYKDSLCSGIEYERIVKYVNSIINK